MGDSIIFPQMWYNCSNEMPSVMVEHPRAVGKRSLPTMSEIIPQKRCSRQSLCIHTEANAGWLPASSGYFSSDKSRRDGLRGMCKVCTSAMHKAYRENNLDRVKEIKRQYYLENRDRLLVKQIAYDREHRDQRVETQRQYRLKNSEALRTANREWRMANPEYLRKSMREWKANNRAKVKTNENKRRARKRNLPIDFTDQDWVFAVSYFGNCCAVCGRQQGLWHTLAADHWIPLQSPDCLGTVVENIVPLCHGINGCNNSKGSREPLEWLVEKFGLRLAKGKVAEIERFFSVVKTRGRAG